MLDMAGHVAVDINVGVSPTLFKGVLPWMLPDYLSAHPYVDVRLAEAYSGTLTDWVVSGEVQVAIVTKPPCISGWRRLTFSETGSYSSRAGAARATRDGALGAAVLASYKN